jgi:hypothetical protein
MIETRRAETAEKARKRALIEAAHVVRARALKREIATRENVDHVIRNLDPAAFRELAYDYPDLSRMDFKPIMLTWQSRPRVRVLKNPNSPVNLIVLVALIAAVVMFALPKCKAPHSGDERLRSQALPVPKSN